MALRVGVVIRTKNRPHFLRRALFDVSAQDFSDWHIFVVNDGGDLGPVDALISDLPDEITARVSVSHNDVGRGRSSAANQGVRAAGTEFVVLHDDDDLWDPGFLSATVRWLDEHPDDIGVTARTEIVYESRRGDAYVEVDRAAFWPQMTQITYADLLQGNRAVPISVLYRRRVHDEIGLYREDVHAAEDWEFYLRLTARYHLGLLDGPPLAYWMQRVGATGDDANSMFALAQDHHRFDRAIRDEALREYVAQNGSGLALYLTGYIRDELERQLADRRGLATVLIDRVRRLRQRRRAR